MKLNDIVLIMGKNLPRNAWPKGRIIDLHPGKDSKIRVVTVKTATNILKRPVAKLCTIVTSDHVVTTGPNIKGENVESNRR